MSSTLEKSNLTHEALMADIQGFEVLAKILLDQTGILMESNEKNYSLMSNRLHRVLKKYHCDSYQDFIKLISEGRQSVMDEFYEVLTTNTTHFFRENEHFSFLKKQMPKIEENLLKEKRTELRVWCAASSTGEEPYTILMTVLDYMECHMKFEIKMFASDINTQVLEKAREGIYKKEFMEYVPADFLLKFFDTKSLLPRDAVQVKSDVRAMIKFIKLNLVQDAYLFPFKFDIIFCRNVMIYFPQSVVLETMRKLAGCLDKKGFLFIGHSETMVGDKLSLKSIVPAVYQHK